MKKTTLLHIALTGVFGLLLSWQQPISRIFLIGDSISIHYEPFLKEYLKGVATLESRKDISDAEANLDIPRGRNGGDSNMVLKFLEAALKNPLFQPDYLLLNCGLHDIKRSTDHFKYQVDSTAYRHNLGEICGLLKEHDIKMIWIRSTPVIDSVHNERSKSFKRFLSDIEDYNRIADEVCKKNGIPVIDLFSFSKSLGRNEVIDHVHYSVSAREKQARYISEKIKQLL